MSKRLHVTALLVLTACLSAGLLVAAAATAQGLAGPDAISQVEIGVRPAEVRRGQSFDLTVRFSVLPGLHIQAHEPAQDYLIGTRLAPAEVEGVQWGQPLYPQPHRRQDPLLGALLEYSGDVRIRLPGVVAATATPGRRELGLELRYQACTDQGSCYPPRTVPLEAALTVLPGEPVAQASAPAAGPSPGPLAGAATQPTRGPGQPTGPTAARQASPTRLAWQPFSGQRLAELTAAGKTVLIDFTADWCPNCKLNEFWALNTRATADLVEANGVAPLVADFTRPSGEIQAWLDKFDSISVPLTVIVPGADPTRPTVLRDTYRQATLLEALRRAGPSPEKVPDTFFEVSGTFSGLTLDTPIELHESAASIWWYLLAGLIGGFILNFMPCVLPVISIKVLSLVSQAGQSSRRVFGLGLAFAGGMIALFLVLGLLIVVAGSTWGGWFQSQAFLLVMLGILVAMAVSLFGAFTLSVPSVVGDADAAVVGEGYVGSFGKGVLAVLLGTPCSGPFLGSVLAWAAAKSAAGRPDAAMLVFAAMGLGMAFPFVVLAAKPGWMRFIPQPGAWMETFKQSMGFLLLLTAVYIVYILQEVALSAVFYALGVGFAAWLYGRLVRPNHSQAANWLGRAVSAAVVVLIVWLSFVALPGLVQAD